MKSESDSSETVLAKLPWRPLALVLLIYLATNGGRIGNEDAGVMLDVTRSMLEGKLSIPEHFNAVQGRDGAYYSPYGPLVSLMWMPAVAVARLVHQVATGFPLSILEEFAASFFCIIPSMGILVYSAFYWRSHGASSQRLRWGVIVVGLATLWWPYSKLPMSDPWMALGIVGAIVHWQWRPRTSGHYLCAGMWLGVAWLARKQAQSVVPLLFVAKILENKYGIKNTIIQKLLFTTLGIIPFIIIQSIYNLCRYESMWIERYPNQTPEGFSWRVAFDRLGLLIVDTNHGFLWFNLFVLAVSMLAWQRWWRVERVVCIMILVLVLTTLPFLSRFYFWSGAVCFGPRYLLFLTAMLGLGWAHLPDKLTFWNKCILGTAASIGLLVAFTGVSVDSNAAHLRMLLLHPDDPKEVKGYVYELRRAFIGEPHPFPAELATNPLVIHPAFQVPDFWWLHAIRYRVTSPEPSAEARP